MAQRPLTRVSYFSVSGANPPNAPMANGAQSPRGKYQSEILSGTNDPHVSDDAACAIRFQIGKRKTLPRIDSLSVANWRIVAAFRPRLYATVHMRLRGHPHSPVGNPVIAAALARVSSFSPTAVFNLVESRDSCEIPRSPIADFADPCADQCAAQLLVGRNIPGGRAPPPQGIRGKWRRLPPEMGLGSATRVHVRPVPTCNQYRQPPQVAQWYPGRLKAESTGSHCAPPGESPAHRQYHHENPTAGELKREKTQQTDPNDGGHVEHETSQKERRLPWMYYYQPRGYPHPAYIIHRW